MEANSYLALCSSLLLPNWNGLVAAWYHWGAFAGLLVAVLAAIWTGLAALQRTERSPLAVILAALGIMSVAPSLLIRSSPPAALAGYRPFIVPAAYAGLLGAVLALTALSVVSLGSRASDGSRCATCGQRLDPTWDRCPYCGLGSRQPARPAAAGSMEWPAADTAPIATPSRPQPLSAWLIIGYPPQGRAQLRLGHLTRIGRDPARNDLVLDDAAASRQHAQVQYEEGQFVLYDLNSVNGTFVNDRRISRQPLANGDCIRLGATALAFLSRP